MGSITVRPNGRFQATYRAPDRKERSKVFDKKADATRWLHTEQADMARNQWIDPSAGRITFRDYMGTWQKTRVHRESTAAQVESHLRRHVLPVFGDRTLASVRPSDIQGWVRDCSAVLAGPTVGVVFSYVSAIFRSAVEDRLIAESPCQRIKLPRRVKPAVAPPTVAEVLKMIDAVPKRFRALVEVAALTGLRPGEVFGLTAANVDLLGRKLTVVQQLLTVSGSPKLAPPKTEASLRTVPLPPTVIRGLERHLGEFPLGPWGLLFTTAQNQPIRRNRFSEVWNQAKEVAGVRSSLRLHDCRHFYASLLIHEGASVKVIQARMGHASAVETLDVYGHLWPDSEDETRDAVERAMDRAMEGQQGADAESLRNITPIAR